MQESYSLDRPSHKNYSLCVISLLLIISNLFQPNYQDNDSLPLFTKKEYITTSSSSTGPVSLSYASYYGQSINNLFHDVVLDDAGNIYATGSTINQGYDIVVAKFDPAGALVWEKFIGGSDAENFNPNDAYDYGKIAIDPVGNIYVTGITASTDFPMLNAFQTNLGGGIDAFIVKLDNDGNLTNSSFLGGNGDENTGGSGGIAVDDDGNIYLAGSSTSDGFFDTNNAYQSDFSGGTESDIFITRIAPDFSTVTGSYWGDEALDLVKDIQLASDGTVWLVGQSTESQLSLTGYQPAALEAQDGIVIAFNNTLSQVTKGTFFGGKFDETINALAIDSDGNILITGSTFSTNDFPTLSAFQANYTGGQEAFAAKLSSNGQLIWSTFIGGNQNESGTAIAVDASGNVVVGGMTSSTDFAAHRTAQETYNTLNCEHDAFLFKFNSDGTQDWATYYGGWRAEQAYGLAINTANQIICVGQSESTDLPVTANADQPTAFTSGINAFISIFEVACPAQPIIIHSTENGVYYDKFWCNNYQSSYTQFFSNDSCALQLIAPPGYASYRWERNGTLINGANTQRYTVPNPGSENNAANVSYRAIVEDGNDCLSPSTSTEGKIQWKRPMCGFGSFDENELPHLSAINEGYTDVVFCPGESISIPLSAEGFCGATFQWQKDRVDIPGATTANYNVTEAGCYRIAVTNSFTGCTVYSITKRFTPLAQVILNDYYANQPASCEVQDSITGCSSVFIRARIPSCDACDRSPNQGVSYSFFLDGVFQSSNTYGYINTSQEGNYTVEVTNGSCTISSNTLTVSIRPTEPPVWLAPTVTPICIQDSDSVTFVISHPAIGDSATVRFDLPSPSPDVITLDSFATIAKSDLSGGCMDVWLTTKEGCSSRTADIKLQDTITPIIRIDGPPCIPVRLRTDNIKTCDIDSVFWYLEDSLMLARPYDSNYDAVTAGNYILRVKNACGDFYSDTVFLSGNLTAPVVSPAGPICLPVNLSIPTPDPHIVTHWYRRPTSPNCSLSANDLVQNQNEPTLIANLPGFYVAILEDTLTGCRSTCSNFVEVQRSVAGANISPSNDIYFCEGTAISDVTLNVNPASPSFSYQWYRNSAPIAGATNSSYTTNTEGVYRVFLENACDNAFTPVVSIFAVENPIIEIDQVDTIYLCGPDTIRLDTDINQPLIYQWYLDDILIVDAVDSFLLATTAGKYQVQGINNNTQCEDFSKAVYILNSTPIIPDLQSTAACTGACSGTLSAAVSGGIPFPGGSYQYQWSNGATTATVSNICTGLHRLTITDGIGCNTIATVTVEAGFSLTANVDTISCHDQADGAINITTLGGQLPFSYQWSNGETTAQLNNLTPGQYQLTVTDNQSCAATFTTTLSAPLALVATLNPIDASCKNSSDGSLNYQISGGTAPYNLQWNTTVIPDSMMLVAGTYAVTVTDQKNCQTSATTQIEEPDLLTINLSISNSLNCTDATDGALNATINGGTPPYDLLWEDGSNSPNRNNLMAGSYMLTVTDQHQCTATEQITLDPAALFSFEITDSLDLNCWGADDGQLQLQAIGGQAPYQYFVNGSAYSDGNIMNLASGNYSIYLTDQYQCQTATQTVTLTTPDSLTVITNTTPTSCPFGQDGQVSIELSGGTSPYQYSWNDGSTVASSNVLTAGNYTVSISDANACQKIIQFTITDPAALQTSFSLTDNTCFNSSDGEVSIIGTTGGTAPYDYFLDDGASPSSNQQLDNLAAGNYTLRTVDQNNCELSEAIVITEPTILSATLSILQDLTCFSGSDGSITATATGGTPPYSYLWEDGSSTTSRENLIAGNYTLTLTDSQNCSTTKNIELVEGPFISLIVESKNNVSCFGLNNGSFTLSGNGGTAPYSYSVNGNLSLNANYDNLSPGTYNIFVTDANGCISEDQDINIEEPTVLSYSVEEVAVRCFGEDNGSALVHPTGGTAPYQYLWSNGNTTALAANLAAGTYSLTLSDALNCESLINVNIESPAALNSSFSTEDNPCFGDQVGEIRLDQTTGGTAPYRYYFETLPLTNSDLSVSQLAADTYEVLTMDANECEFVQTIAILETPPFGLDLGEDMKIMLGENAVLNLDISNGTGIPTMRISPSDFLACEPEVLWSDCPNPVIVLPTRNMQYLVELIDEQGCLTQDEIRISVDRANNHIYMPNVFSPTGSGENSIFYVQATPSVELVQQFVIVNRWGAEVYKAKDFSPNDESFGWDGSYKGRLATAGVYVWMIAYQTIDGKQHLISGDITLLR